MDIIKSDNQEIEPYWKKVTYTVETAGQNCSVTAHLPEGFTMREFTRVFSLRHAPSLNMTDEEYILFQQSELMKDLMNRISYKPPEDRLLS